MHILNISYAQNEECAQIVHLSVLAAPSTHFNALRTINKIP